MKHAIEVIHDHGSRLPEAMHAEAVLKYFYSFRNLECVQDILAFNTKADAKTVLKQARAEALEKKRNKIAIDSSLNLNE